MELDQLLNVIMSDFRVNVWDGAEHIIRFDSYDSIEIAKYGNTIVMNVFPLDEDVIAINVKVVK